MEELFNDDVKVKVNRIDTEEVLIDGEFATTYVISIDRCGQISRSYCGLCNKDLIKAIELSSKQYLKKLKKEMKNRLLEEVNVEVKREVIPEKQKLNEEDKKTIKKDLSKKKDIYDKLNKQENYPKEKGKK
jgi:hypothetical protein